MTLDILGNGTELYTPSEGIYNRCTRLYGRNHCANFNMDGMATDSSVFPTFWKLSLLFMMLGLAVMGSTVLTALLGCCVQSIGRKSIFDLSGVAQAIAGQFTQLCTYLVLFYSSLFSTRRRIALSNIYKFDWTQESLIYSE